MTKVEIAKKLKEARNNTGLKQADVAAITGKSIKVIGHWETGYSQPDADMLATLLKLYNVDANSFFEIEKAPAMQQGAVGNGISLEESNSLLVRLGFIKEGEQLSDEDLAFLASVVGLLDAWFSRKKA